MLLSVALCDCTGGIWFGIKYSDPSGIGNSLSNTISNSAHYLVS